ncbi:MlaD family protein [Mycobacterium sp. ACS4331]|uniref:MCE family protein n=1 Tax=Mycobacterium sp. ACS4331 TaxID=1834121 RepID=UPI00080204F3|nr:MlaD family protein [Mycobacterium sp. ACS4331]OBF10919.1 mammalian cell entry protein [Mycobacterium sp. ACS4331]
MRMTRRIWIQITIFLTVTAISFAVMAFGYMRLPNLLFGYGHYRVTVELPEAGGLYERSNVSYLGTTVGLVERVILTDSGDVEAVLSLRSDMPIPSDVDAQVHSRSAVGEQYVALLPVSDDAPPLAEGDVIPRSRTSVPPDINALLDATNTGLQAIPGDNLRTLIDESYTAFGGLGPEISRFVKGSTNLAIDAKANLPALTNLADNAAPILDTQTDTADSIEAWAVNLADITGQLREQDGAVAGLLQKGPAAADQVRQLFDRVNPTLPVMMANLANIAPVLVTYSPAVEQLLVLIPMGNQIQQGTGVANRDVKLDYKGAFLSFNLNLNLPPPCTTGFLPASQMRDATHEDAPERTEDDLYCRIPQDAMFNVRGVRNFPCIGRPGKRAPTARMCESDEEYVPLNDGLSWKGDPNATLSGQGVPHPPVALPSEGSGVVQQQSLPPIAVATYDPATGTYVGPDGQVYRQGDLANAAPAERTWESMLVPPAGS